MKHILLLTLLFCSASLSAQSLIVTTEGNPITGYEVEVSSSGVFYKSENNADSPFIKLDKRNVLMIRHADGSIVNLTGVSPANNESTITDSTLPSPTVSESKVDNRLDEEYNQMIISKYNTPAKITFEKEMDKERKPSMMMLQHYATEDSQFASKDLIVSFNIVQDNVYKENGNKYLKWIDGRKHGYLPRIYIQLENRSGKSIFIDLANTFLIRGGESVPYYVPGAISSIGGGSTSASVNLGSIAGAVGVGGAAGAIARGVNVGSSASKYTTNTTYSQRIIAIPPKSIYKLDRKDFFISEEHCYEYFRIRSADGELALKKEYYPERIGESIEWDESNTPYKIANFLTYSFSEDFVDVYTLSSTLYPKRFIGIRTHIPTIEVEMEGSGIIF